MNVNGKTHVFFISVYLYVLLTLIGCMVGLISASDTCPQSGYGYTRIKYSARQPYDCTLYTDPHNPGENECAVRCSRLKTLCPFFSTNAGSCTVCVNSQASNTTTETLTAANYSLAPDAFIFEKIDTQNQCSADICLNNGTCTDGFFDYHCNCTQYFTGKNCETVPYDCKDVGVGKHISAGAAGVWAISETNTVMLRHNGAWQNVGSQLLNTIGSGLIVCGCAGTSTYCKQGFTEANPGGEDWTNIGDAALQTIDVSENGYWLGLNQGNMWRRGNSATSWHGSGWSGMETGFRQVSFGAAGVWVITNGAQVKYRVGTYDNDASSGSTWRVVDLQGVEGSPQYIESTSDKVWLCTANNEVYKRAVSADQPTGVIWVKVQEISYFEKISIQSESKLWGITGDKKIMECDVAT